MLITFKIQNSFSINTPIELSLCATSDKDHEGSLISHIDLKDEKLLPCVAIYGANASGKTNILDSIYLVKKFVTRSHQTQMNDSIFVDPFRLNSKTIKEPSVFEIEFVAANGIRYRYELSITSNEVVFEKLYSYENNRQATIFDRVGDKYIFTQDKVRQNEIAKNTLKNVSYLAKATQSNYAPTQAAFLWFLDIVLFRSRYGGAMTPSIRIVHDNEAIKAQVIRLIDSVDIGVRDFKTEKKEKINEKNDGVTAAKEVVYDVKTVHRFLDVDSNTEKDVVFDFFEESGGTQALFNMAAPLFKILKNGGTMLIDEFDSHIHPLAQEKIIELFMDPKQNVKGAQLILNTHNTNLLDLEKFRRDQILFTEKKDDQSTDLYSLADLTPMPRKGANIQKGYLAGKYGGIPFVSGKGIINE